MRESIDVTRNSLVALQKLGVAPMLRTPVYDAREKMIQDLWVNAREEMLNPRNCGEGDIARGYLSQIQQTLPGFRQLSGETPNCRDPRLQALIARYKTTIDSLLSSMPEYKTDRVAEKRDFTARLKLETANAIEQLNALDSSLRTGSADKSQEKLDAVIALFGRICAEAAQFGDTGVQCQLPVTQLRAVGDRSQIVSLLGQRMGQVSTYVYIFIALAFDIFLIALFSATVRSPGSGTRGGTSGAFREYPQYLWTAG